MYNLLIGNYNNYFNRIVKKEDTDFSYFTVMGNTVVIKNINFNPNDGIATQVILGKGDYLLPESATRPIQPDYAILFTTELENPPYADAQIISRWFITESIRTRSGQYQLTLKRDVLVDNYDKVINSPCYIEKATIDDLSNPLLYNSENFNVNQIKTSETLIKDRSGVAWVVGYISRKFASEAVSGNFGSINLNSSGQASGSFTLPERSYLSFTLTNTSGSVIYATGNSGDGKFNYSIDYNTNIFTYSINLPAQASSSVILRFTADAPTEVSDGTYTVGISADSIRTHLEDAPYDMFCIPYGIIHLSSANIYTDKDAALKIAFEMSKDIGSPLYDIQLLPYCPRQDMVVFENEVSEIAGTLNKDYSYIKSGNTVKSILIWCKKSTAAFTAAPETELEINRGFTPTAANITESNARFSRSSSSSTNASLTVYGDELKTRIVSEIVGFTITYSTYSETISAITSFSQNMTAGSLTVNYTGTTLPTGSYRVSCDFNYKYKVFIYPEYLDYKVSNECDLYRLVSPNYNGQFEWSLAKSSGESPTFDVDITYKPYQPYIHVAPVFNNLYGQDFDDARGLICGGDFSLPIVSDAWTQYQVQNKTYQEMFDREILNFDTQRINASNQAALQGGLGIITGGIAGAAGGGKAGGAYGAAAGGVIGMAAGTAGMIGDMYFMNQAYDEQRDFKIDMFNYNLQNIQALPYTLTKVAAYTANNKIFPMVEYYTCKDVEKQALRDKLKYNGMTVMIIGTINDYIDQNEKRFIKGQMIRLSTLEDDSHVANEIYNEISKGVYI